MFRLLMESSECFSSMQAEMQTAIQRLVAASWLTDEYSREGRLDIDSRSDLA